MTHIGEELALGTIRGFSGFFALLDDGFRQAALGDVPENTVGTQNPLARAREKRAIVQPDPFTIFAADAVFHVELLAVGKKLLVSLPHAPGIFRMNPVHPKLAAQIQKFLEAETQHSDGVATDINQVPIAISRPDHIRNMVNERTIFFFARA